MSDGLVNLSMAAFDRLQQLRSEASRPPLRFEDLAVLLTSAVARSSRELQPRKDAKFVGLSLLLSEGEIKTTVDEGKPSADELAVLRDWVKKAAAEFRAAAEPTGRKRLTAHELLDAAAGALKEKKHVAEDEARTLRGIVPRFEHAEGQVSAEEVVAIVAAAFRRNERRLGLLVTGGSTMSPEEIVAVTEDGRQIKVDCADGQAPRELVDEMCDRFDTIIREHRQEQPEKFLANMSAHDRDRYDRNADSRGLPTLEVLVEETRRRLAEVPERWAPLKTLELVTSARSGIGLPSRPAPSKFVDSRLRVRHGKFGEGFVERTFEDGERKYEVLFDGGKRVTLLARFLETVEAS